MDVADFFNHSTLQIWDSTPLVSSSNSVAAVAAAAGAAAADAAAASSVLNSAPTDPSFPLHPPLPVSSALSDSVFFSDQPFLSDNPFSLDPPVLSLFPPTSTPSDSDAPWQNPIENHSLQIHYPQTSLPSPPLSPQPHPSLALYHAQLHFNQPTLQTHPVPQISTPVTNLPTPLPIHLQPNFTSQQLQHPHTLHSQSHIQSTSSLQTPQTTPSQTTRHTSSPSVTSRPQSRIRKAPRKPTSRNTSRPRNNGPSPTPTHHHTHHAQSPPNPSSIPPTNRWPHQSSDRLSVQATLSPSPHPRTPSNRQLPTTPTTTATPSTTNSTQRSSPRTPHTYTPSKPFFDPLSQPQNSHPQCISTNPDHSRQQQSVQVPPTKSISNHSKLVPTTASSPPQNPSPFRSKSLRISKPRDKFAKLRKRLSCLTKPQLLEQMLNIVRSSTTPDQTAASIMINVDINNYISQCRTYRDAIYQCLPSEHGQTDPPCDGQAFRRCRKSLIVFKDAVTEMGRTLVEGCMWMDVIRYCAAAAKLNAETPVWQESAHNNTKSTIHSRLEKFAMRAIKAISKVKDIPAVTANDAFEVIEVCQSVLPNVATKLRELMASQHLQVGTTSNVET